MKGERAGPRRLGGDLTNPQSLNRYAYVLNNPTTLTDPLGLDPRDPCDRNPNKVICGNDARGGFGPPAGAGLFGLDEFDLAALGLLGPLGPANAALPGCGAQFATCVQFAGGTVGFDSNGFADLSNIGDIASDVANGEPYTGGASSLFLFNFGDNLSGAGGGGTGGCTARIIGAVNQTFGTSLTTANLATVDGRTNFTVGGGFSIFLSATNLPAAQFNAIVPGRYPLSPLTAASGYGPTLHIATPGYFDQYAVFSKTNIGGVTSVLFTAHTDSAFAFHPIGGPLHGLIDVLHFPVARKPCP